ncbi:MAG: CoA transferase [Steroidobacteraceae bacterium]
MAAPLEGLTVVDCSWGMPGGVTSLLLADNGARVIKVERPSRERDDHSLLRLAWERGKQSIELDVRSSADRDTLFGLLAHADVFIESLGPGRAQPLGLDHATLAARWPRLVVCSLTGYGHTGPWRDEPGYDCLVAAKLGLMTEQASAGREAPVFLGHPHIGYGTGFIAAIGIMAAIRARHLTQRGQLVDVSLLDGLLAQSPMNWWLQKDNLSYVEVEGGRRLGFGRKRLITAAFECGDGEWLQMHTGGQGGFKRTMEIFGFGDITQTVTEGSEMAVPLNDEEFVIARDYIPEAFKLRPRHEWIAEFEAADIAVLPVLRQGEVLVDPQVKHADMALELQHPTHGRILQPAPPLRFGDAPLPRPAPAPARGQHSAELRALAAARPQANASPAPRPLRQALEGIRVIDFASFFASPYGAKILGDLGADVIQVEAPGGDQMRPLPNPFEAAQRGKRNVVLNLKSAEGRALAHELVRSADIVVHNYRPGKADKVGLDWATLSAINPRLIYCHLPGYGSSGPRVHQKAFAPLISGLTGLLYEAAGAGNKPVASAEGNEDYYNGLLGAVAALAGLEQRERTGKGVAIVSPQLHSSLFVTSHLFLDGAGKPLPAMELDSQQTGYGPLYRLYPTSDHWICIACVGSSAFARLARVLELPPGLGPQEPARLAAELERRFAALSSQQAFERLRGQRVPCEIPAREPLLPQVLQAPWAEASGQVVAHADSIHGPIREVGLYTRLSDTPGRVKGPAPRLGQHTVEVLRELGRSDDQIRELAARNAIFCDPKTALR